MRTCLTGPQNATFIFKWLDVGLQKWRNRIVIKYKSLKYLPEAPDGVRDNLDICPTYVPQIHCGCHLLADILGINTQGRFHRLCTHCFSMYHFPPDIYLTASHSPTKPYPL
jgi:hypothetical protein